MQQSSTKKLCNVINYCAHIKAYLTLRTYQKIKDSCLKSFESLQYEVETQMSESLSVFTI